MAAQVKSSSVSAALITRRNALQVIGAGTFALWAAGCGGGQGGGGGDDGKLVYWTFFGSDEPDNARAKAQGMILDAFRKANPDIEVEEQVVPWDQLHTRLLQAAKAGKAPDVSRQLDQYIPMLAQSGAIVPLDEYIADWDEDHKADFVYPWDDTVVAGKKMAFRQSVRLANLNFFRADVYPGWEKRAPKTIEQFTDEVKRATKRGLAGFVMPFSKADGLNRFMQVVPQLYWDLGSDLVDPATSRPTFHEQAGQQIFQWFQDLIYRDGVMPKGVVTMDSEAVNQGFSGGSIASNWHTSSQWAEWSAMADKGTLGQTLTPSFSGEVAPVSTQGGWTLAMSKDAHRPAAWKLIEFFHSREAELIDAQAGGEMPTRPSTLEDPFFSGPDFARQREWLEYLQEHGHAATVFGIQKREEFIELLGDAAQDILANRADVATRLAEAADAYSQVLA
jgi:multiple sugar transport system substrate-binding protein